MQYLGSKSAIAKQLLEIMLPFRQGRAWVEPFVGGANMIDKLEGLRIGNDANAELISLWRALQSGWIPPEAISREEYASIKANQKGYPPELVCFVGLLCSFGGKWFGGYAANAKGDNYAAGGKRALLAQLPRIKDVVFTCSQYSSNDFSGFSALIYCDPPYEGTTAYKMHFDSASFWQWVREQSINNPVFVSEYKAPPILNASRKLLQKRNWIRIRNILE